MQYNKSMKFLVSLLTVGIVIWFGGGIVRSAIAFDLFVPGTELVLKAEYSDMVRSSVVRMFAMTGFYTSVAYMAVFIAAVSVLVRMRRELKQHGWLFMALIFFLLFSPIEGILIYHDLMLVNFVNHQDIFSFHDPMITEHFTERFRTFSTPSALSFLSGLTAIMLVVWRPLEKGVAAPAENQVITEAGTDNEA